MEKNYVASSTKYIVKKRKDEKTWIYQIHGMAFMKKYMYIMPYGVKLDWGGSIFVKIWALKM